ncbi:hypothetical protein D3C76_941610 [compost metagenome]
MRLPRPMSSSRSSISSRRYSASMALTRSAGILSRALSKPLSTLFSRRSPRLMDSERRCSFKAWRMCVRALPVTTKLSHAGFGRAPGALTISTVEPLCSGSDSGARRRLIRQAMQLLPTSVCTA